MNLSPITNRLRPKFRHLAFFTLCFVCLFESSLRAGGSSYDEPDCDCGGMFDSYDEPEPQPVPAADEATPPECVPYIKREIQAAILKLPEPKPCAVCQTCPIAQPEKAMQALAADKVVAQLADKTFQIIKIVKVKKGWWIALYVKKSAKQGADYAATRACNGFKEPNPLILPGQMLKICRWK
ncbi:MAG: hypothetical protein UT32_C0028G0032 [Parcubacteria group bacterium GW2011_GWC2_39_14]|nr:MAG: hypothetical protein UT32_C0028G0032 [Parcubacteria group bacterium GW2011_GWC2_39_14]